MRPYVTVLSRYIGDSAEYFFSTDHCQPIDGWVPTTHYLPSSVVPRPELPSGRITNREELVRIFYHDAKEIPNPMPEYQA